VSSGPKTLLDKIWASHEITRTADGASLLYVDQHYLHEGSRHAFERLREIGRPVRRPEATVAFADHLAPTFRGRSLATMENPESRGHAVRLIQNTRLNAISLYGLSDAEHGIVHVAAPELGLSRPGMTIACGDSHTSTHGAFGALAFGIGASDVCHVLATQTLWLRKPPLRRVRFRGRLAGDVSAKDLILTVIGQRGVSFARGHALEFSGELVGAMSMEERMTLCNMGIEAGARFTLIAPDETTFKYLEGRHYAPRGEAWDRALEQWRGLRSDPDMVADDDLTFDAGSVRPAITWGTSPEDVIPVDGVVPDPAQFSDVERRERGQRALTYMGLRPGQRVSEFDFDRVFIGSCTNGRLDDLREAAAVLRGRRTVVETWVVPGSRTVMRAAEAEGLDEIFRNAGCDWREPGCSMCIGMNGDTMSPTRRCASTSNRNFEGRQGRGARTHLVSPRTAAWIAVSGGLDGARRTEAVS
jgi:3-isopropylmalate/(R)-2-methylmalate dehydratase large subunit